MPGGYAAQTEPRNSPPELVASDVLYNFDNVTAFAKSEGLAWPYNSTSKAELFQQYVAGCAQHPGGPIVKISESVFPHTIADFKVALGLNKTASPGASYGVAQCNA